MMEVLLTKSSSLNKQTNFKNYSFVFQPLVKGFGIDEANMFEFWDVSMLVFCLSYHIYPEYS